MKYANLIGKWNHSSEAYRRSTLNYSAHKPLHLVRRYPLWFHRDNVTDEDWTILRFVTCGSPFAAYTVDVPKDMQKYSGGMYTGLIGVLHMNSLVNMNLFDDVNRPKSWKNFKRNRWILCVLNHFALGRGWCNQKTFQPCGDSSFELGGVWLFVDCFSWSVDVSEWPWEVHEPYRSYILMVEGFYTCTKNSYIRLRKYLLEGGMTYDTMRIERHSHSRVRFLCCVHWYFAGSAD